MMAWTRLSGKMMGDQLKQEKTTINEAKEKCLHIPGCRGFFYRGTGTAREDEQLQITFCGIGAVKPGKLYTYTSFLMTQDSEKPVKLQSVFEFIEEEEEEDKGMAEDARSELYGDVEGEATYGEGEDKAVWEVASPAKDKMPVDSDKADAPQARDAALPVHIFCIGNPGSGKSTLLNALIDEVFFKSGFSVCQGCTKECQSYVHENNVFVDTPGLADVDFRKRAAEQISEALNGAARVKLLFVVTLEGSSLRPEDTATIALVIESLVDAGIDYDKLNFAMIINKYRPSEAEKFNPELQNIECFVAEAHCGQTTLEKEMKLIIPLRNKLTFVEADIDIEDKAGELLRLTSAQKTAIVAVPVMKLQGHRIEVKHDKFDERMERYRARIGVLVDEVKKQKKHEWSQMALVQEDDFADNRIETIGNFADSSTETIGSSRIEAAKLQIEGAQRRTTLVLFIGNKGVGTSTLRALAEKSMVPVAGEELKFFELEGLADTKHRKEIARKLIPIFNENCSYRVFFIIVLNSGRLRKEDQQTVKLLQDAVPDLKTRLNIIINKMTDTSIFEYSAPDNFQKLKQELCNPFKVWFVKRTMSFEPQLPSELIIDNSSVHIQAHTVRAIDAETADTLRETIGELENTSWMLKARELSERGMTLKTLLELYEELPKLMPHYDVHVSTTSDVVRQAIIVKSWSGIQSQDGEALAPFMEKRPVLATRLISHTWTNPFAYTLAAMLADAFEKPYYLPFVEHLEDVPKLREELKEKGLLDMRFWFCAVSVNQHDSICGGYGPEPPDHNSIQYKEWDSKRRDTKTQKVYKLCQCRTQKHFNDAGALCEINKFDDMLKIMRERHPAFRLVVAVDPDFILFSRIWCIAELVESGKSQIQIKLKMPSEKEKMKNQYKLKGIRIQDCKASRPEDVNQVLEKLRTSDGDESAFDKFNASLKELIWSEDGGLLEKFQEDVKRAEQSGTLLQALDEVGQASRKLKATHVFGGSSDTDGSSDFEDPELDQLFEKSIR